MSSIIYFGSIFLAKVLDNALSTTKTILIQRSRWLLAGFAVAKRNMKCHDPKSPFLPGGHQSGDVIHEAVQKSWIDRKMRLEL